MKSDLISAPMNFCKTAAGRPVPALALIAALAGCAAGSAYTVAGNQCNPARHQALVGRNVGEIVLPPALTRREISPGMRVTEDYNPQRLNMYVDPKGWVGRITCG